MISVTFRGVNFQIPEPGDAFTQGVTDYLNALSTGAVPFPTSADVDLGASGFGLKAAYFKTRAANPSASGVVRLSLADLMAWRNNANNGDLALGIGAQNQLQFSGSDVTGHPMLGANTGAGQSIANGATVIVVFGTVELDTDAGYNSGTGRYTIPAGKGGHYLVTAQILYNLAQTGTVSIQVFKNAAQQKFNQFINPPAIQPLNITAIVSLAAGDIIDIRTTQPAGTPQSLNTTAQINYLALKRIPA